MDLNSDIDITTADRQLLLSLIRKYLPDTTVWAFGSRVKHTSRPESDLDLVAFVPQGFENNLYDLRDELAEANLPFSVDIFNWHDLPDNFRRNIEACYVPIIEFQ